MHSKLLSPDPEKCTSAVSSSASERRSIHPTVAVDDEYDVRHGSGAARARAR